MAYVTVSWTVVRAYCVVELTLCDSQLYVIVRILTTNIPYTNFPIDAWVVNSYFQRGNITNKGVNDVFSL